MGDRPGRCREFAREQDRLRKEQATVAALREKGDHEAAERVEAKLGEVRGLDGVNHRAAAKSPTPIASW
jgi:hypothetical protein